MINKKILLCSLLLIFMTAFGSVTFAATPPPYASIVAYNADSAGGNGMKPNVSTLGVLDIVNMTPWDISVGPGPLASPMLAGMSTQSFTSFWLAGFHTPSKTTSNFGGSFAFHSLQVPLNNLNNAWNLKYNVAGYTYPVYYDTIPIVFGANNFTQTNGKTVALNFSATSTLGFDVLYYLNAVPRPIPEYFPATALSYGDGTNSYGWQSNDTVTGFQSATHFLTIQALQGQTWKPITKNLGGIVANKGVDGSVKGATVQSPNLLNVAGMIYPNFSQVAGDNESLDLVVILQAGGYGDMQLLFLAVPSVNNSLNQ